MVCGIHSASKQVEGFSDPAYIPTVKIRWAVASVFAITLAGMFLPAKVNALPTPEDVPFEVNMNLIIEFYR